MGKPTLQPIAPDELPDLLARLDDGRTTNLALIGREIPLSTSPDDWPEELRSRVVYRLTGELSGLPRELLRLDRLQTLTLWLLGLRDADAAAIAEQLGQLTSLDLGGNKVGDAGARAIAKHLRQLTSLKLSDNDVGDEAVTAIGQHLTGLVYLDLGSNKRITTISPLARLPLSMLNIAETGVAD